MSQRMGLLGPEDSSGVPSSARCSAGQQAAALSQTRGARQPPRPLGGAAGQLSRASRLRDPVCRRPGCGVQIGARVWDSTGLSWLFAARLTWPQLPAVAAPRPSKAGLHIALGLAWRSGWGSRGRAARLEPVNETCKAPRTGTAPVSAQPRCAAHTIDMFTPPLGKNEVPGLSWIPDGTDSGKATPPTLSPSLAEGATWVSQAGSCPACIKLTELLCCFEPVCSSVSGSLPAPGPSLGVPQCLLGWGPQPHRSNVRVRLPPS